MITAKKLLTLKERTRIRKIALILQEGARQTKTGKRADLLYINTILPIADLKEIDSTVDDRHLVFILEDYSQILLSKLGAEPSDWDFIDENGVKDISKRVIQDKVVVIDRIRSPFNVGSIFRSADSFGIKKIVLVEGSASPDHVRARRTSMGCTETVEWAFMTEQETIDFLLSYKKGSVIALELGGSDINSYSFPPCGVIVLGNEELGISPEILKCCTARVSIPMGGTKGSLNVSVAAGITLQRWFCSSIAQ